MTDAKPTSNSSQIRSSDITPPPELVQQFVMDEHYEWELQDSEGEWQAGGSANDLEAVRQRGLRCLMDYSQDEPHKLIIRHHQITVTTLMEMATPNVTTPS